MRNNVTIIGKTMFKTKEDDNEEESKQPLVSSE